jgi:ParB-like chromosome segregation protein Spo0J
MQGSDTWTMTNEKQTNQVRSVGSQAMVDRVEIWEIGRLIPSARNARTHSDAQVAEIAGSIRAFGFNVPVLVDKDGSIIAGHGRVLAARQLKLERIPVLVIDHLNETETRAYAIADNKIALNASWDEELLQLELAALKTEGIEPAGLGFSEAELNALIKELEPVLMPNQTPVPGPVEPTSQAGDVWQLGDHSLLCGERDRQSCDVILSHWQELTGEEAIHTGTGKTFAQRSAERSSATPVL